MPRRSSSRALKSWMSAMRAALRLASTASSVARRKAVAKKIRKTSSAATTKAAGRKALAAAAGRAGRGDNTAASTAVASPRGVRPVAVPAARSPASLPGGPASGRFRNASGTRGYRLYHPRNAPAGARLPLIVMLHGCTQDAAHFAAITRMHETAGGEGCWVLYPEQAAAANRNGCWNWFEPAHQQRGAGEPAILAGLVRKVMRECRVDTRRVFVAGLSAGGAMALVLARVYPDIFRAAGACAGMPYGSARTATTALLAMRGRHRAPHGAEAAGVVAKPVPTCVIHGDRDRTVACRNAEAVVAQALEPFGETVAGIETGVSAGRGYTRTRHRTHDGRVAVEKWIIHGAGHAWPGGAPGAFSDPLGADASAILLRFFLGTD